MLQLTRRRTWALSGQPPLHPVWNRNDRLFGIRLAITVRPRCKRLGVNFRLYEHND